MGVLWEGLQRRGHIGAALNGMQVNEAVKAEEEWPVTKAIGMGEVRGELENWREAAKEYMALAKKINSVRPMRSEIENITGPVEILPGKAVYVPGGRQMEGGRSEEWSARTSGPERVLMRCMLEERTHFKSEWFSEQQLRGGGPCWA